MLSQATKVCLQAVESDFSSQAAFTSPYRAGEQNPNHEAISPGKGIQVSQDMVSWQDGQLYLRGTSEQQDQKIAVFVNSTKYSDSGFSLPLISYVDFGLFIPLCLPQFL